MNNVSFKKLLGELTAYLPPHLADQLSPGMSLDEATPILIHLTSLRYTLSTYLPRYLLESITARPEPGRVEGQFRHGTLLLADVSGFTALSEKLAAQGREGTEEMTHILNQFFDPMLDISADYGGDLLKFGGDSLLIFFEGDDSPHRAVAAGQAMLKHTTSDMGRIESPWGTFALQISIGVGSGPVFLAGLGSPEKMEHVVRGNALSQTARAEDLSGPGQLIVDAATHKAVHHTAAFTPLPGDFWQLETLLAAEPGRDGLAHEIEPPLFVSEPDVNAVLRQALNQVTIINALRPYLPPELVTHLAQGLQQFTLPGRHRPVTIMFANFYGFDELIDALGPPHLDIITRVLNIHFLSVYQTLTRYGGVINKVDSYAVGHRVVALFGALRTHEDDPARAVHAALAMHEALAETNRRTLELLAALPNLNLNLNLNKPLLKQRIGLNTGFVFAGNIGSAARREYSVIGDEVNLAARLMGVAKEGQILISHNLARTVKQLFALEPGAPVQVKGKTEPVPNFLVISAQQPLPHTDENIRRPMVGRDKEFTIGQEAIARTLSGEGGALVISGFSGIGKTRLIEEITTYSRSAGLDILAGECLSYGGAMAYHPWDAILRTYFDIQTVKDPQERLSAIQQRLEALDEGAWSPIIGEILGLTIPDNDLTRDIDAKLRRQRILDLTLKLLQHKARQNPLLVIIEDLHWADPASIDLINYVIRNIAGQPILFILSHRQEENLPDWAGHSHVTTLDLKELSDEACLQIAQHLVGPLEWPPAVRNLILNKGAGNPFFVEEVVRSLIDTGILTKEPAGRNWQINAAIKTITLPETIHGIILSRIDRLPENDQRLLQVASVIGQVFALNVLEGAYAPAKPAGSLMPRLAHLNRLGLTEASSPEHQLYRFKHLTTREVMYESLSFEQRRATHRRIAEFIEQEFTASLAEQAGLLAFHYFEAHTWLKAIQYNLQVARQARREFANDTALTAYRRLLEAAAKIDADTAVESLQAHEGLAQILALQGRYDESLEHYAAARNLVPPDLASDEDVRRLANLCRQTADIYEKRSDYAAAFKWLGKGLDYLVISGHTIEAADIYLLGAGIYHRLGKNDEAIDWCLRGLTTAYEIPTRQGKQAVGHACYLLGGIYIRRGNLDMAINYCHESVRMYRAIEDINGQAKAMVNLANAYADQGDWQQSGRALAESLAMKEKVGDIFGQGIVANNLAYYHLEKGNLDKSAQLFEQSLSIWKQLDASWPEAITLSNLAQVHIYRQNWPQAQDCLRQSQAIFEAVGSEDYLPELERRWGEYYLQTGETEQALAHTLRSISLASFKEAGLEEGMSRRILGEIHLTRGELAPAQTELQTSLRLLTHLNSDYDAARTRVVLARLALAQNDPAQAKTHLTPAIQTFEKLGALADLQKARALAHTLPPGK